MKKTIILILFIFSNLKVFAQIPYHPIPLEDAVWKIAYYDGFGNLDHYKQFYFPVAPNDTLINIQLYRKLYSTEYSNPFPDYVAGIREDTLNQIVYIVPKDSLSEYILYDFSKNVGDTINNIYCTHIWDWYSMIYNGYVYSINTIMIYPNVWIKQFQINSFWSSDSTFGYSSTSWAEYLGGKFGLVSSSPFNSVSGYQHLDCMSYNDTIRFGQNQGVGTCNLFSSINRSEFPIILVYPNPADNFIKIQLKTKQQVTIKIFSALGELMSKNYFSDVDEKLDISQLKEGVYFISIENLKGQGIKHVKFLKIKS